LIIGLKKDREAFDQWMACFRRAMELDPNYSDAYAGLSMGYLLDHQNRWSDKPELSLGEAERLALSISRRPKPRILPPRHPGLRTSLCHKSNRSAARRNGN
jgi:hypothetical protein